MIWKTKKPPEGSNAVQLRPSGILFGACKRQGMRRTCPTMIDDSLHLLANEFQVPDWCQQGEHLPVKWIEEAVQRTDATSIRHRRLPAEQAVWLMVVLALYHRQSISEVLIR
jgi:hypothetical protein